MAKKNIIKARQGAKIPHKWESERLAQLAKMVDQKERFDWSGKPNSDADYLLYILDELIDQRLIDIVIRPVPGAVLFKNDP